MDVHGYVRQTINGYIASEQGSSLLCAKTNETDGQNFPVCAFTV